MTRLAPRDLAAWLQDVNRPAPRLLDVREPWEVAVCRIGEPNHLPMRELPLRLRELDPDAETVVICHHGVRSLHAAYFLERQGFARVFNLEGGVAAWARDVDPAMPVY